MQLLLTMRLSWFFFFFMCIFFGLSYTLPGITFSPASLTLFSVNSFLYGFYISPILSGQKQRIDDMTGAVRTEANALFDMLLRTKKLPRISRNKLQNMFSDYMIANYNERRPAAGEAQYEALITYCLRYSGIDPEVIAKVLDGLIANQQNRSQVAMMLSNKIYSNEWLISLVLFAITIGFVLFINVSGSLWMHIVKALLCTGLSMLMVNLLKLTTLTHKRAYHIWDPLDNLKTSRFRSIEDVDSDDPTSLVAQ
jgi:hypothetical protein